ncbi:MAG: hypothetical protein ACTHN5_13805 [Phycisphaerae bacterium]
MSRRHVIRWVAGVVALLCVAAHVVSYWRVLYFEIFPVSGVSIAGGFADGEIGGGSYRFNGPASSTSFKFYPLSASEKKWQQTQLERFPFHGAGFAARGFESSWDLDLIVPMWLVTGTSLVFLWAVWRKTRVIAQRRPFPIEPKPVDDVNSETNAVG